MRAYVLHFKFAESSVLLDVQVEMVEPNDIWDLGQTMAKKLGLEFDYPEEKEDKP